MLVPAETSNSDALVCGYQLVEYLPYGVVWGFRCKNTFERARTMGARRVREHQGHCLAVKPCSCMQAKTNAAKPEVLPTSEEPDSMTISPV